MGRNGYSGVEVYMTKLKDGTKFKQRNGTGEGIFTNTSGYPVIIDDNGDEYTIPDNYVMNISTQDVIPFEAYVYKSVFYADEIKRESGKLYDLQVKINDVLLNDDELGDVCKALNATISNLKYVMHKFETMDAENHHKY